MTTTRTQRFCQKYIIDIGYYDNIREYPSFTAEKNKDLHF